MSNDAGAEAGAGIGGLCSAVIFSILQPFCNTKQYGSGGGNHVAGCCGSCFNNSFNEDKWDRRANAVADAPAAASATKD
ncbi:unnamed protein product, partial [Mycena citricolor]